MTVEMFFAILAVLFLFTLFIYMAKNEKERLASWLIYAVTVAEKELGEKTGKLKLMWVYDMFLEKFPMASRFISFELFSKLVDIALDEMKHIINTNWKIKEYIKNGKNEE